MKSEEALDIYHDFVGTRIVFILGVFCQKEVIEITRST